MADNRTPPDGDGDGVTRRGFISSLGVGAVAAATAGAAADGDKGPEVAPAEKMVRAALRINGATHSLLVEARWSLLFVLREKLGLTATKVGCERGECGACTVLVDGRPRYACLMLALEAEGAEITTAEGLMQGEELGDVQQAFLEEDAFQCGYCTPGQVMAAEGLLRVTPQPSVEEVRSGMSGNLCRCGAYPHIVKAVRRAADIKGRVGGEG